MTNKPLYVRVAEALGWTYCGRSEVEGGFEGEPPDGHLLQDFPRRLDQHVGIPRYDTDWSATGPLIERFCDRIITSTSSKLVSWRAVSRPILDGPYNYRIGRGPTPLIAVCNLILALKEAGKL